MPHRLSPAARAEYEAMFNRYDLDGNGRIDREELRAALRESSPGIPDDALDGAMAALDDDGNGSLDLAEFLLGMAVFHHRGG